MALPDWRVSAEVHIGKADRLQPLIPRHTARSTALYESRGAIEREFGQVTHD
jgi:hypothetical protein